MSVDLWVSEEGMMDWYKRMGSLICILHDLVTEDVWEWEEVDAPEAAATTTTTMNSPKRTPEEPKKKSFGGKKKSGGAQQDLFSFWKKR